MEDKHIFLTYGKWDNDKYNGFNINHHNLTPYEIQLAIDMHISERGEMKRIIDELLLENKYYKDAIHNKIYGHEEE